MTAQTWRWQKNTAWLQCRWQGGYGAANYVPACWILDFNWTPLYTCIQLNTCIFNTDLWKIWLAPHLSECNSFFGWGMSEFTGDDLNIISQLFEMWTKHLTNWAISLLIISIVAMSSSWLSVTRSVVRNTSLVIGISLHCNSHIKHYFLHILPQQNFHIWKSNYQAIFQIPRVRCSSINLSALSLHDCHYGISEGKIIPGHNMENTMAIPNFW